ncbi:hypothetical protein [Curtobacterium sp. USHLN213]|uniref:hypothetical protein n=1 Tax=Curtobacterium sp. USHLN213 TaxID=3081255 RepID=UPI003019E118
MSNSFREAAESRDAAVQNMRAGNTDLAQTHALMAIMHLLSADHEPKRVLLSSDKTDLDAVMARVNRSLWNVQPAPIMPTAPGVYQDREGVPWYRTKVESDRPWMDLTHGHSEERWFTDEHAAQYAPFSRMEAIA